MPSEGKWLQSLIFMSLRRNVPAVLAVCFSCATWAWPQTSSSQSLVSQKPPIKKQSGRKNMPASFQGAWDPARAQAWAMARLKKAQRSDEFNLCYPQSCAMQHRFLNEYRLTQRGSEAVVLLITSTLSEKKCNGCAPILSAFKFEKNNTAWELRHEGIFFSRWGPYVEAEADLADITVSPLADDAYGIFLTNKSVAHGHAASILRVYASIQRNPLVGCDLCRVLELQTGEEDSGAQGGSNHWNAIVKTQLGNNRLYDLLITREGIRDGKTVSESERLKFNGRRYIPHDWNSRLARSLVLSKIKLSERLKEKGRKTEAESEFESKPQVLDEYFLAHRNYESVVVLGASSAYISPASANPISLFEFQRRKTGWKLVHSEMEFALAGNYWGNADSEDFELSLIGYDTFGVFLQAGTCSTGSCESLTEIYANAKGKFRDILRLFADGLFPGGPPGGFYWDFQIRLKRTTTGFYDLAVSGIGERAGDPGTFRFDGVKYVSKTWR